MLQVDCQYRFLKKTIGQLILTQVSNYITSSTLNHVNSILIYTSTSYWYSIGFYLGKEGFLILVQKQRLLRTSALILVERDIGQINE